jgi:hypothetical protein
MRVVSERSRRALARIRRQEIAQREKDYAALSRQLSDAPDEPRHD